MSNREIQPGDMVRLKTGGNEMTVASITDNSAACHWFDNERRPQEKAFPLVALEWLDPEKHKFR